MSSPILIAGGGIGGLAVAIALAMAGARVRVLEQRQLGTESAPEEGAGIQIGPNGVHCLRRLGVADRLAASAGRPEQIVIRQGRSGRQLAALPLGPRMEQRFGAPYWVTRRSDLHGALLARVREFDAIEIVPGFRVAAIEVAAIHAQRPVTVSSADGATASGRALIGADGLWSQVAPAVLGAANPRFTGRNAARALLPMQTVPAVFREAVTGLWLGPKAHLVHYPVAGGALLNVVAVTEAAGETRQWAAPIDTLGALKAMGASYAGWCAPVQELLALGATATAESALADGSPVDTTLADIGPVDALLTSPWRSWSLFERAALPRWHVGPVTVLGDAAHPVLPFLAQGAVLALEDAIVLADVFRARPDDPVAAFAAYAGQRQSRAARVTAAARRNGVIYHLGGIAAAARDAVLPRLPAERLIDGYDWLYGYAAARHRP